MRVVAFTKYDREAAATRQRFLQYAPHLHKAGIDFCYRPLLDDIYVRSLATGEHWSRTRLLKSYARRLLELLRRKSADLIWVQAELFPYLPAAFEKLVFRSRIPVVYDCDDAYFLKYNENPSQLMRSLLAGKVEQLMAGASAATCGNEYLRDYAGRFCRRSVIFPTVVDVNTYKPAISHEDKLTIGWIGSPSTWANVRPLLPVLSHLSERHAVIFRAVGAGVEAQRDCFAGMEFAPWSEESEIAEVQGFDVGIMPLLDGAFERGKSAYKLVQYMACGIPAVAAPIGANETVLSSECGFFATTEQEWEIALVKLISEAQLRRQLGAAARARAIQFYSLQAHAPRLIELFRTLAAD
jgi:glycosyltransferase involved in cell wall biosynthesis